MNQDPQETILSTSQELADRGEFEKALFCLSTMESVMVSWMRSKIYLSAAEQLSKDFVFKFYRTPELKAKYEDLLTQAHNHLCKTAQQLPYANDEIRDKMNKCLWGEISKVEYELASLRPVVEEEKFQVYEDDYSYIDVWAENLVDDISDWKLE